jgi:hypothetical protein
VTPALAPDQLVVYQEIVAFIDETIETLVLLRGRHYDTNAGAELDAVAALIAHARSRLPGLVAEARDQANTWTDIAGQLGINRLRAIVRYGLHARRRRVPLDLD